MTTNTAKKLSESEEVSPELMKEIHDIFAKIRWRMGAIPASCKVEDVDPSGNEFVAYWHKMQVVFGRKYVLAGLLPFIEDATYHELGHAFLVWEVPGTFRNMVEDTRFVCEKLSENKLKPQMAHPFLNIVYDTIDDTLGAWEFGRNPIVILETIESVQPKQLEGYTAGDDKIDEWLTAFRQALMKQPFSVHICKEVQKAACESLQIVRKVWDNRLRVQKIAELIYPFFMEEMEKTEQSAEELKEKLKELGVGNPLPMDEEDLEKALEGIPLDDPETRKIVEELLGEILPGVKIDLDFEALWRDAGRKVRFQLKSSETTPGEKLSAGDMPWVPGMPMRDLDIERTLEARGKFIPGVTTLTAHRVEGPGQPAEAPAPNRMALNVDVSGSMNAHATLMAIFTFIREAERRRCPVAVHLFGNQHYCENFTTQYHNIARRLYDNYCYAGGGNSVAGPEKLQGVLQSGDLLLYVTDFGLTASDQQTASVLLQQFMAQDVSVIFIAMFEHHLAEDSGLKYVECKNIDDLAQTTLTTIAPT